MQLKLSTQIYVKFEYKIGERIFINIACLVWGYIVWVDSVKVCVKMLWFIKWVDLLETLYGLWNYNCSMVYKIRVKDNIIKMKGVH